MSQLPLMVRIEVMQLVPSSVVNEISCFTFYYKSPCDTFDLDIIVCTNEGEIIEFYERNVVFKALIPIRKPKDIQIHKNPEGFHYVISGQSKLVILKRKQNTLEMIQTIESVSNYKFKDSSCCGEEYLNVWVDDDALPLVYNYKFNLNSNYKKQLDGLGKEELLYLCPVLNSQRCRLTEAKFVVNTNECTLKKIQEEIKELAYSMYCKMYPQLDSCVFKKDNQLTMGVLRSMITTPVIKYCNNKLVIIFNLYNDSDENINDLNVILHDLHKPIITYETKIYKKCVSVPFWVESTNKIILSKEEATLTTIINLNELNDYIALKIQLCGIILYKLNGTLKILPFENINISHKDTMDDRYNVLSMSFHSTEDILAIIASSEETKINITHIKSENNEGIVLLDVLSECLNMKKVSDTSDIILHATSPYHRLHGVMICQDSVMENNNHQLRVYSRCKSQVISLMHHIYDSVHHTLLVTLPQMQIKTVEGSNILKESINMATKPNITSYADALKQQMRTVMKFYDECDVKMTHSKIVDVISDIGVQIYLNIGGKEHMDQFVGKLSKDIENGFDYLDGKINKKMECNVMEVDDEVIEIGSED